MPGVWTASGSIAPSGTSSRTSAMVVRAPVANAGPKFRAPQRYVRFPAGSACCAQTSPKSARIARSKRYGLPSNSRTSLPSSTTVPTPTGV